MNFENHNVGSCLCDNYLNQIYGSFKFHGTKFGDPLEGKPPNHHPKVALLSETF